MNVELVLYLVSLVIVVIILLQLILELQRPAVERIPVLSRLKRRK